MPTSAWKPALLEHQTGRYSPENLNPEKVRLDDMVYTLPGMDVEGQDNTAFSSDQEDTTSNTIM